MTCWFGSPSISLFFPIALVRQTSESCGRKLCQSSRRYKQLTRREQILNLFRAWETVKQIHETFQNLEWECSLYESEKWKCNELELTEKQFQNQITTNCIYKWSIISLKYVWSSCALTVRYIVDVWLQNCQVPIKQIKNTKHFRRPSRYDRNMTCTAHIACTWIAGHMITPLMLTVEIIS